MKRLLSLDKFILLLGDVGIFYGSLWLALLIRGLAVPTLDVYLMNAIPFSGVFAVWVLVFYIASLYEPHVVVLKSRIPAMILNVQGINSLIAAGSFYMIPAFGIAPKTILFLLLVLSLVGVMLWRIFGVRALGFRRKERAVLIGSGEETRKLYRVVNESHAYPMHFVTWLDVEKLDGIDFTNEVLALIYSEEVSIVVIDLKNDHIQPILPKLYNLIFSHVRFVDQYKIYEDIFDAIPLSLIGYNWFLENVSSRAHFGYDLLKRIMDTVLALFLFFPSLLVYPFVMIGTALLQPGPVFFLQTRIGKGNRPFRLYKFRTMTVEDRAEDRIVTYFGKVLRNTRIDELPQLINVLRGELSLIGPRPEIPELVAHYSEQIPYYNVRHLITPGLSGWAQVHHENHPHHGADVKETKNKLAYDLYYLKNRSLALDIKIALKTIKTLLSRQGR